MANGAIRNEQFRLNQKPNRNEVLLVHNLYCVHKETAGTSGVVTFVNSGNRYIALIFILQNNGLSSIYGAKFKQDSAYNAVEKIMGDAANIQLGNTGNIAVSLDSWSRVDIISTNNFT